MGGPYGDNPHLNQSYNFYDEEVFEDEVNQSRSSMGSLSTTAHGSRPSSKGGMGSGEGEQLMSFETRLVKRSKLLVYMALTAAAVAVSCVAYHVLSREQDNTMRVEFSAYSREILKQAQANSLIMFEELMETSKSITSHALDSEMAWPNVTLPHFDIRAHQHKNFTLEFSGFAPFVKPDDREGWESYSVQNQDWIAQDYYYRGWNHTPAPIPTNIHRYNESAELVEFEDEMFRYEMPLWQVSPAGTNVSVINLDLATVPIFAHLLWDIKVKKVEQYGRIMDLTFLLGDNITNPTHPRGTIYQPVFADFTEQAEVLGFMIGTLTWDYMFQNVIFGSSAPLLVEIEGSCNAKFTYKITGKELLFLGYGEGWRDTKYDKYKQTADLLTPKGSRPGYPPVKHTHRSTDAAHGDSHCTYVMNTYPTVEFASQYSTNEPIYMTLVIASVFAFTAMVFLLYDFFVEHRQKKLFSTARNAAAIVSSLFPKDVQKRMMKEAKEKEKMTRRSSTINKNGMSAFLNNGNNGHNPANCPDNDGAPIADLFPSATIMFADICGFTAWSSAREPSQVFILLESLYGAFDAIAKKRRVFKVETIGDCYVAVCGLPEERANHATVMARFARDCLTAMEEQLRSLETTLGPDTCDLGMRVGLHSGPVTAGVLRGDRARFQLFGDSVNTCARIETTGKRNRIHISQETADLLIAHGKENWVEKREDEVEAKGKGKLSTFWLSSSIGSDACSSHYMANSGRHYMANNSGHESAFFGLPSDENQENGGQALSYKDQRLVDWHVSMLSKLLQQIQARRNITGQKKSRKAELKALEVEIGSAQTDALQEVKEIIKFPIFTAETYQDYSKEGEKVALSDQVVSQLYHFISEIAATYHNNDFHNFEHASHVTMSVTKLLSRIVQPSDATHGVDHGYGIISDPLTQFAVVLSAIIHDADHPGIPNSQMIKEEAALAALYKNKSVAEQNSFQLAWEKLMTPAYSHLRDAIYSHEDELLRFREICVNSVMATDIMDKDLGAARKARWNKAFSEETPVGERPDAVINRKATIVIEHLIQASDVAHTQQHWHIYIKWNERLFMEMYKAYKEGRAEKDPSESWYNGELGFFDFYIIPLAKKLKDCGVFGVSSDEYLNYAEKNRAEWESKGQDQVKMYLHKFKEQYSGLKEGEENQASLGASIASMSSWQKEGEAPTDTSSSSYTELPPAQPSPMVECSQAREIDIDDWIAERKVVVDDLVNPVDHPLPTRGTSKDYRHFLSGLSVLPTSKATYEPAPDQDASEASLLSDSWI